MERDSAISHGASSFLRERLMLASDGYQAVFCITCGNFAVNNVSGGYRSCAVCGGNDFGTCTIPYVYKLLTHLLSGLGIYLRPEFVTPERFAERMDTHRDVDNNATIASIAGQLALADAGAAEERRENQEVERGENVGYLERDRYVTD